MRAARPRGATTTPKQRQKQKAPLPLVQDRKTTKAARSPAPSTHAATTTVDAANNAAGSSRSSSHATAPQFSYLVLAALDAVGVTYISMDHLRKAKKGRVSEREYLELWKLLHDLVLVVLADFDVDADEMRRVNAPQELEATLWDRDAQQLRVELVRYYLYAWGFVCSSFYDHEGSTSASAQPASSDLLLATAWLLAFGEFFERLHVPILERCMDNGSERLVLPPYPNDAVLTESQLQHSVDSALAAALRLLDAAPQASSSSSTTLAFEPLIHQLHVAFGRLESHSNELKALERYHARLLQRLELAQNKRADERDALLPAFVLQLLAQPRAALEYHVQLLAQRVKMLEDEKLFYKWVNSLVATHSVAGGLEQSEDQREVQPPAAAPITTESTELLAHKFPALYAQVRALYALLRDAATAHEQVAASFDRIWRAYRQDKRAAQVQRMECKMERVALDVSARELFDPQKLYLQPVAQQAQRAARIASSSDWDSGTDATTDKQLATEQDLASLRNQLARVLAEISTEYCGAELR